MTMIRHYMRLQAGCLIAALSIGFAPHAGAQAVPASTAVDPNDEVIVLSPFVVESTAEDGGYVAKSTLAGTRVRTELKDIASSISVVTKQFLQDTGSTNAASLLVYTPNTEVGGVMGNFSGNGGSSRYNEDDSLLRPGNNTRVRGLDSADNTRGYFQTDIPWDSYNVDRVDLQRGPNSILFGVGSPAGIINTGLIAANFKEKGSFTTRIDQFGSWRNSLDMNEVLIPGTLAMRLALLDDNAKFRQDFAYNHDRRIYAAINYRPKVLGDSPMSILANVEFGKVTASRPRTLPPVDSITPWFLTGVDAFGNPNLNKKGFNRQLENKGDQPHGANPWLENGAIGRQFWNDITASYDVGASEPKSLRQTDASVIKGIGPTGAVDLGIGGQPVNKAFAIASPSSYFLESGIPGGSYYADVSLSDPTIFDFYNKLIDGPNKSEWQKWKSANIAISQTWLKDRVGIEAVYDYQNYQDGQRVFIGASDTYKIGIDINSHFTDGTANPNFGRAYVANSDEQANSRTQFIRDSIRLTGFAELKADDVFERDSMLAKILGRHVFTGLYSEDTKQDYNRRWATSAATTAFTTLTGEAANLTAHFRSYNYVTYLSESLASRSSASGANLSPVTGLISAPASGTVTYFDQTWNKPTSPSATGYVDPAAPYSYNPNNFGLPAYKAGGTAGPTAAISSSQSENPANYRGWTTTTVNFLNADRGDIDQLTYDASVGETVIESQAFTWQGYLFGGNVVPVYGWRKDKVARVSTASKPNTVGIADPNPVLNRAGTVHQEGESKSYGVVAHLPQKWLPSGLGISRISAFYNKGENFKADTIRGDITGRTLPNPKGETKEYGVAVAFNDDRVQLKATWYETTVANATLSGGNPLGQNAYFLWAVPVWGTAFVTNADQGIKGNNDNNSWAWNYAASDDSSAPQFRLPDGTLNPAWQSHPSTVAEKAMIEAWRQLPIDQTFLNAYGNEVAIMNADAIKAGNWTAADPIWATKFDNQPISGGNLAGFGTPPVFTVDTKSKGVEFELIAKPTKNWNVSANVSKTFATRAALAPTIVKFMEDMTQFLAGPAGNLRLWGSASNQMRNEWQNNVLNPYKTFKSQEGSNAPEISPWRFNVTSNYSFDSGRLKGSWFGGAYRWEQARVLGYEYSTSIKALDISKPWKGDSESHLDLWFGHSRMIRQGVNWKIQVNLRNVGESKGLTPVSINPNGTVAFSRITEGMVWQLSNTFEF